MIKSRLERLTLDKKERDGRRKITYRDLAEETGLSYGTISRLMTGKFEHVENKTLEALCRYFGCQVGDLLEYVEG